MESKATSLVIASKEVPEEATNREEISNAISVMRPATSQETVQTKITDVVSLIILKFNTVNSSIGRKRNIILYIIYSAVYYSWSERGKWLYIMN